MTDSTGLSAATLEPGSPTGERRLLVLGLGNDLLSDDAIGLHLAREIQKHVVHDPTIEVQETCEMGLSLLDFITGYSSLLVVDAVQTGQVPPGFLHVLDAAGLKVLPAVAPHFLGLGEILALGKALGLPMPQQVKILAVEIADPFTLSTQLTPPLQHAFSGLVPQALAVLQTMQ